MSPARFKRLGRTLRIIVIEDLASAAVLEQSTNNSPCHQDRSLLTEQDLHQVLSTPPRCAYTVALHQSNCMHFRPLTAAHTLDSSYFLELHKHRSWKKNQCSMSLFLSVFSIKLWQTAMPSENAIHYVQHARLQRLDHWTSIILNFPMSHSHPSQELLFPIRRRWRYRHFGYARYL